VTQPHTKPIEDALAVMTEALHAHLKQNPLIIGIHTGGVWIAERLHHELEIREPMGTLDITFYRDDFTRIAMNPQVRASHLPVHIDDRHIILVDDVLHTGRTARAAMNALFDYGRPKCINLAVVVERDGRELPIQPDIVGQHLQLGHHQHVKLLGPEPLRLEILEKSA